MPKPQFNLIAILASNNIAVGCVFWLAWVVFLAGIGGQRPLARAQEKKMDFAHDVVPILKQHCVKCHAGESKKGGFAFNTRQELMHGGESGPAVVAGQSSASELIARIESKDDDLRMPPEGAALSAAHVRVLRNWIDAGIPWDEGFAFKLAAYEPPLKPRRPTLPDSVAGRENPIDRILDRQLATDRIEFPKPISDETFLRRAYLDLIGLLPTPGQKQTFLADSNPRKRQLLIRDLLANETAYAEHWLNFWNDLLRNDYGGTGFITGGRTQISRWLYKSLIDNKPYDQFARELLAPSADSAGFSNGIRWRGTVSAGQTVEIQFAQSVGQSFLGINLKCASCHDSFIDRWKLDDAYGLAAIYSTAPMDIHRCDKSVGKTAAPSWLFPELGQIDGKATQPERLKQLAVLMTHPENGRFTRTIVNRLWHRLMGHGIVHPVDAMQTAPWNADLLDFLAVDFADHHYDLKHTLAQICNSAAYQSQAEVIPPEDIDNQFVFRGPRAKRLTAEQFVDSVWQITGTAPTKMDADLLRGKVDDQAAAKIELVGKWIWSRANSSDDGANANETISIRRSFPLQTMPSRASLVVTCDNSYTLYINGAKVAANDDWENVVGLNVESRLKVGNNEILIVAKNGGDKPNPAAAFCECKLIDKDGQVETIATDDAWQWTAATPNPNGKFKSEPDDWQPAVVVNRQQVWSRITNRIRSGLAHASSSEMPMVRASLVKSDFLQRTLGRPNRDQIVTMRPNELSSLEALDLNNEKTLSEYLERGSRHIRETRGSSVEQVVPWIINFALSREPTDYELSIARDLCGAEMTQQSVQDFLWAVMMQPEFQLVR